MIWLDVALKGFAMASAVIATLRAGSRAAYLMEHEAIGIMEGPVIRQEGNETNPLFELSEAFRHCVRLSIVPQNYENVRLQQKVATVVEPYLLSPLPYIPDTTKEDEEIDEEIERLIEEATNEASNESPKEKSSFFQRQYTRAKQTISSLPSEAKQIASSVPPGSNESSNESSKETSSFFQRHYTRAKQTFFSLPSEAKQIASSVPPGFKYTKKYLAMTPKLASNWALRTWNWSRWKEEEIDLEDLAAESDWDYNLSTEAEFRFNSTEGAPRVAELAVFSPKSFQHLRSMFDIPEESYSKSIFESGPFVSFQSNSKGAARAGGVFFFTRDGAYMIKTIKKEEAKTFLKMLPKYHAHMQRHGRKSLLTRFCGMYGVRIFDEDSLDHGQLHTFIVMNAVFPAEASRFISERFDLKGSTVGREVSEEELKNKGSDAVLKDLDLAREVELVRSVDVNRPSTDYGLSIGATAKAALLSQLREDVKLLVDCQVMDYSLLVGVVNMEAHSTFDQSARKALEAIQQQDRLFSQSKRMDEKVVYALTTPVRLLIAPPLFMARKVRSFTQRTVSSIITLPLPYYGSGKCGVDGGLFSVMYGTRRGDRAVYYMGLIDFLQPWTSRKYFERKMKGAMGYDTNAISCVTPEEYASRFLEFLDAHVS